MKAIFIDAVNHTVEAIDLPYETEGYRAINTRLGCDIMTLGFTFPNMDALFVDDEGLLKNPDNFFILAGYEQPLAGNGLVLGGDEWGESCDVKTAVEEIRRRVTFVGVDTARGWFRQANADRAERSRAVSDKLGGVTINIPYPEI